MFAGNRALWLDEAMLATNFKENSLSEMLHPPFKYVQVGAIGYMLTSKALVNLLGHSELALRLLPLLAGGLSLLAFYRASRLVLSPTATIIGVLLLVVCEPQIYYCSEVRPYSLDVLATILITWLSLRVILSQYATRQIAALVVASAALMLFSATAMFVTAASFSSLIVGCGWRARKPLILLVGGGLLAAAVGSFHYLSYLEPQTRYYFSAATFQSPLDGFMPLPPRSLGDLEWYVRWPLDFFVDPGGFRAHALMLIGALIGGVTIGRTSRNLLTLLVAPFAVALAASAMQKFPFITYPHYTSHLFGRNSIYLVPIAILLASGGLAVLFESMRPVHRWAGFALIAVIAFHPLTATLRQIRTPVRGAQDIRPCLAFLQEHVATGDTLVLSWMAEPPFRYYRDRFDLGTLPTIVAGDETVPTLLESSETWVRMKDWDKLRKTLDEAGNKRLWLLFSYHEDSYGLADSKFAIHELKRRGNVKQVVRSNGAVLYQFEPASARF